jgi:transposase-like protein
MNQPPLFCPSPDCPASGVQGQANIHSHAPKENRWRCTVCDETFVDSKGTVFYRKHTAVELMVIVITLLTNGCPVAAIVAAFGLQARTVNTWLEQSGQPAEALQAHLVEQPLDHAQVQADEIRCKTQSGIVWLAMALAVPTRLWLGGRVSLKRDRQLIATLCQLIARCCTTAPLLVAVDGLAAYAPATLASLRLKQVRAGQRGRPRLLERPGLLIGQVVKQRCKRRLVGIIRRLAYGDESQLASQLAPQSSGRRVEHQLHRAAKRDLSGAAGGTGKAYPTQSPQGSAIAPCHVSARRGVQLLHAASEPEQ